MASPAASSLAKKELVVFDVDGTLTPSKSVADKQMVGLLMRLLERKRVAVIGGGKYSLFKMQLLDRMPRRDALLTNFFLFPTNSNAFYRFRRGWKKVYEFRLPAREKKRIRAAFKEALTEVRYVPPEKVYGVVLEDRESQMSFSPLGQDIAARLGKRGIRMKEEWKKKHNALRARIARLLAKKLPELEVRVGGLTTIDITPKGIDKAYGIRQIEKKLHVPIRRMVFVGDALFPGGNDHAAKRTGVRCIAVSGPEDTKRIIRKILAAS